MHFKCAKERFLVSFVERKPNVAMIKSQWYHKTNPIILVDEGLKTSSGCLDCMWSSVKLSESNL